MTGDLDEDGWSQRHFLDRGMEMCIAQSFAKIMGLYGERTGALHIVCKSPDIAKLVTSHLKVVIRSSYSSPPLHGARIASMILKDEEMRQ